MDDDAEVSLPREIRRYAPWTWKRDELVALAVVLFVVGSLVWSLTTWQAP
jgi:hypothetical protein